MNTKMYFTKYILNFKEDETKNGRTQVASCRRNSIHSAFELDEFRMFYL